MTWTVKEYFCQAIGQKTAVLLITEKKAEIFHSLLREHNDARSLPETAKVIASCGFLSAFKEAFVPFNHRGIFDNNLWLLTGKTAEFLLKLFQKITSNSGKAHKVCSWC